MGGLSPVSAPRAISAGPAAPISSFSDAKSPHSVLTSLRDMCVGSAIAEKVKANRLENWGNRSGKGWYVPRQHVSLS